jgi:hypothetical protein
LGSGWRRPHKSNNSDNGLKIRCTVALQVKWLIEHMCSRHWWNNALARRTNSFREDSALKTKAQRGSKYHGESCIFAALCADYIPRRDLPLL